MNNSSTPILTIGLVVHNGATHLSTAIESILNQSFGAFQLVVYDNASTDGTFAIAQRFGAIDSRVRVVRHSKNIGVLANFVAAAEAAQTPLFCWAAHDDVREPAFFETLVGLLRDHPDAHLACCAVRNIDPDGTIRDVRPETLTLRNTDGLSSKERLLMYLNAAPGTPMYGVFRTHALQNSLDVLRRAVQSQRGSNSPLLGVDMVFLAAFLRNYGLAICHEPLLRFRRGGLSHRVDPYGSALALVAQAIRFHHQLGRAVHDSSHGFFGSMKLRLARCRYVVRYLTSPPMRRMYWHHLGKWRLLRWANARWTVATHPAYRLLKRRCRKLPSNARVAIFGGGKHTQRCYDAIRAGLPRGARIVAVCDDAPEQCKVSQTKVQSPTALEDIQPHVIIVSSDAYEAKLFERASQLVGSHVPIWCIYDTAIESTRDDCSAASTDSTNSCISTNASAPLAALVESGAG